MFALEHTLTHTQLSRLLNRCLASLLGRCAPRVCSLVFVVGHFVDAVDATDMTHVVSTPAWLTVVLQPQVLDQEASVTIVSREIVAIDALGLTCTARQSHNCVVPVLIFRHWQFILRLNSHKLGDIFAVLVVVVTPSGRFIDAFHATVDEKKVVWKFTIDKCLGSDTLKDIVSITQSRLEQEPDLANHGFIICEITEATINAK